MPKKKKSKKRGVSSRGNARAKDYKPGAEVGYAGLKEAMIEALFEGDHDTFKGCIAILLDKIDYQEIMKATGLSKSTLYRMCEPSSNPTLENISRVLRYVNKLQARGAA